ncbi:hypothetical protein D915_007974 [Fasciola hepatica]|uniref:Uncharacterized protein n=1 Tax=Fasciola hepatica TaxID=6192 RepID=A0A4E0RYF7_FASHE|nr:hypothetical protein D915_007974 [Fasciola hepatica]
MLRIVCGRSNNQMPDLNLIIAWIFVLIPPFHLTSGYNTRVYDVELPSESVSLDLTEPQNAINVKFTFTGPKVLHILRFIPAVVWKQSDACSNRSDPNASLANPTHITDWPISPLRSFSRTQLINQTRIQSLHLANVTYLSNRTENEVLPLEFWADRSVLVFTIRNLSFRKLFRKTRNCGRIRICSIPWNLASVVNLVTARMDVLCSTALKKIYLSCADEQKTYKPLILPLAHALALEVDGLGARAQEYKPSLTITASSGYSLPAGQFCCPDGLFACSPPSRTNPTASRSWSQRICMPPGLRCDGTINCPIGDSDERNCSDPQPTHFSPIVEDELEQFIAYLQTVHPARLITEAGYTNPVLGAAFYESRLSWYTMALLIVIVLFVFGIVLFAIRWSRKRRAMQTKKTGTRYMWWSVKNSTDDDSVSRPHSRPISETGISDANDNSLLADNNSLLGSGKGNPSRLRNDHSVQTKDNSFQIPQSKPTDWKSTIQDHVIGDYRPDNGMKTMDFNPPLPRINHLRSEKIKKNNLNNFTDELLPSLRNQNTVNKPTHFYSDLNSSAQSGMIANNSDKQSVTPSYS